MRRYELNDTQWSVISDLFPCSSDRGRPRRDDRTLLNAIFWMLCSGAAWRDLPERYGPWQTAYDRFSEWKQAGLFDQILRHLHLRLDAQELIDLDTWMVDATSIRASKQAAGARKKKDDPSDQALGRSRGGLTTKIHMLCDSHGIPLAVDVFAGHRQESTQLETLLASVSIPQQRGRSRCRPKQLLADKGYDIPQLRRNLRKRGIRPGIPLKAVGKNRQRRQKGPRPHFDRVCYQQRNVIERLIGWLKEQRRIAMRFEKKASHFLAMVKLAGIRQMMKTYFSDTA